MTSDNRSFGHIELPINRKLSLFALRGSLRAIDKFFKSCEVFWPPGDAGLCLARYPASQHPCIPASQHPCIPASQHPCIPMSCTDSTEPAYLKRGKTIACEPSVGWLEWYAVSSQLSCLDTTKVPRRSFWEASLPIPKLTVSAVLPALSTPTCWQTSVHHPPSPNPRRTSSRQRPYAINL